MRGKRIFIASLLLAAAAVLPAVEVDYFPLHVGNQWVYRGNGTRGQSLLTLEITRAAYWAGRAYWLLHGLPEGDFWLRMDDEGNLWAYDPAADREQLWYAFGKSEGEEYRTALPGSQTRAVITSRKTHYKGPVGEAENALEIRYPGVFQVGIERELFLPYIGLVERRQNVGGPAVVTYELIYSRTGGVTVLSEPALSVSLTIDRATYYANLMPPVDPARAVPLMTARLSVRNTTGAPIELVWPSGQRYDFVIRDEKGQIVWRWSEGRAFTLVFGTESFSGERNYTELIRLGRDGKPFPPGKYTLEAWLATQPRIYAATAGFEIQYVY